ncbi:GNAT family N-acetyltransferase [Apibacter sp. HY039]|uniref:GNAT family N-acetyltransferase n=1 Tax=Apibacter sp. HY039 TaxID=2501476 RepID=UPI000FEB80E2|nr:GNAT family N-acetyltransferase [Apibacter sp. HY039]
MNTVSLRKVELTDIEILQDLAKKTFYETFESFNTKEDMQNYLNENFSIDKLRSELENPLSEFYFAEFEHKMVGYLKINSSKAQTEIKNTNSLEIERIYILQGYQKMKIGQLLFEKALSIAKTENYEYIWLGVWEENPKAIAFYKKNGFIEFDKHIFRLGDDEQTDIMMKLNLK